MHLQTIAAAHHIRHLDEFLGHNLGHLHLTLHIVVVLLETAHLLNVARIIGVIVVYIHRGELIEALHEHAFTVGIDKTQRTCHLHHAPLAPPVLNGFQEGCRHLKVIDEVEPAEAHLMTVPTLIGPAVDDSRHAPHDLPVLIGQEILGLTTLERWVLVAAECGHLIEIEERHSTITTTIEVIIELNKLFQF